MLEDFTNLIENHILDLLCAEEMRRESCADDGNSGAFVITMRDGRKFRIVYQPA